jgi:predicted nuclease of predicted toxin-antitoxin system
VKLKLDEGLSYRLKPTLQEVGHDVDTVVEEGLTSVADAILAEVARQNDRMLFTLDKGLGDLRQYPPGEHPGIVVFRLRTAGPGAVSRFVEDFVRGQKLEEMAGCLVIVEPGRVRIRRS